MIQSRPNSLDNEEKVIPDLTPLLDIIFIVMVFLLLTANIQVQTLEIDIPQTPENDVLQTTQTDMIVINVLAQSPIWGIQGKTQSDWHIFTENLLQQVKSEPQKPVVIAADKDARVEDMLSLLAFLQKNNIQTTNLVMDEK